MSVLASETTPSKRIRWKAGKEDELWDYMQKRVAAGANVSEALKGFAQENGISWLTARWKYYRLKQDKGSGEEGAAQPARATLVAPAPAHEPAASSVEREGRDAAFTALRSFLESASKLNTLDLAGFLGGLSNLTEMALAAKSASGELSALRSERNELAERVSACEAHMSGVLERLCSIRAMVSKWLEMPGIDRVTSLEEFAGRLTTALGGLEAFVSGFASTAGARPRSGTD